MDRKKNIIIFVILLLFILPFYFYGGPEEGREKEDEDEREIEEEKQDTSLQFYVFGIQGFNTSFTSKNFDDLNLDHEIYFHMQYKVESYSVLFWAYDRFRTNFKYINATDHDKLVNNDFFAGLDNKLRFKNLFDLNINFYQNISTLINNSVVFTWTPEFQFKGNYYYGFYWKLKNSFSYNYFVQKEKLRFSFSLVGQLGYEFFRFYGPVDWRFSIEINNDFSFYINDHYWENDFNFGVIFKIYHLYPHIFLPKMIIIYQIIKDGEYKTIYSESLGFKVLFQYSYHWFTLSAEYTGKNEFIDSEDSSNPSWSNQVDVYVKFEFVF